MPMVLQSSYLIELAEEENPAHADIQTSAGRQTGTNARQSAPSTEVLATPSQRQLRSSGSATDLTQSAVNALGYVTARFVEYNNVVSAKINAMTKAYMDFPNADAAPAQQGAEAPSI